MKEARLLRLRDLLPLRPNPRYEIATHEISVYLSFALVCTTSSPSTLIPFPSTSRATQSFEPPTNSTSWNRNTSM